MISSSIYVVFKSSSQSSSFFDRLKEIWSLKWIYISTLSTIYDQATDVGVLIYWYNLNKNENIEHIDLLVLFILSCIFCSISRLVNLYLSLDTVRCCLFGVFLGTFDLLITEFVWGKVTNTSRRIFTDSGYAGDGDELTLIQMIQTCEVLFESLPQILLQSLFLIRTYNNNIIYNNTNILLVWISLFLSIISATNKFANCAIEEFGFSSSRDKFENKFNIRCNGKCPTINIGILSVKIFCALNIITRLFIYSLLWSVVGGIFVVLFFVIGCVTYVMCLRCNVYDEECLNIDGAIVWIFWSFLLYAIGFMPNEFHNWNLSLLESSETKRFLIHNLVNIFAVLLILYFGIENSFNCNYHLCADKEIRNLNYNRFAFIFIVVIFLASLLQIVLFFFIPTIKALRSKKTIMQQTQRQRCHQM